jgi:hypothetical protein
MDKKSGFNLAYLLFALLAMLLLRDLWNQAQSVETVLTILPGRPRNAKTIHQLVRALSATPGSQGGGSRCSCAKPTSSSTLPKPKKASPTLTDGASTKINSPTATNAPARLRRIWRLRIMTLALPAQSAGLPTRY